MNQRFSPIQRALNLPWSPNPATGSAAAFLWGPRQTGKTTLLRQAYPDARFYDLLDSSLSADLSVSPHLLREQILADSPPVVVIDEVQKIPALLEEVHWLLENTGTRFVLCGSSARKLRRKAHNLLGGRAVEHHLLPLTSRELPDLDLVRYLNHGGLPAHYLADEPDPRLRSYVNAYIREEIIDESATRNVPAFARFLQVVGLTHGQQLNYANIARETGVSPSTVRAYFQILGDTLLGFTLEPWRRSGRRRLVETAKFFLFDVGVARALRPEMPAAVEGSDLFGRAFEHFLLNEVRACLAYTGRERLLAYWRTHSGFEVDLIVGDMDVALEFKSGREVRDADLRGLRALAEDQQPRRSLVVARVEQRRRTVDGIEIVPWREFCEEMWAGRVI
jgi:predicted AAA+ superfamily ATPase